MTEIAKLEYINTELKKFTVTDAAIAGLNNKYSSLKISGIDDKKGYTEVRAARLDVKSKRVEVEKKRKELTADALEFKRAIDSEAKRITGLLEPLENYLEAQEKEFDAEKERVKKEKERLEQERVSKRTKMLLEVGMIFDGYQYRGNYDFPGSGHSSQNIINIMVSLEELKNDSEDEFNEIYADCYLKHEAKQNYLAEEKRKQEEFQAKLEAARLEAQRIKAEEIKVENERLEKIRIEQQAERERLEAIAREQADKEAALKVESDRIEALRIIEENKIIVPACEEAYDRPNAVANHDEIKIEEDFKPVEIDTFKNQLRLLETYQKLDKYSDYYSIELFHGEKHLSNVSASDLLSECPEDATLGRALHDVFNVIDFFKIGYEAGKNNEEVSFETKYLDEDENEITKDQFNNYENYELPE
jgi:hypothetical protein